MNSSSNSDKTMNKIDDLEDIVHADRPLTVVPQTETNKKDTGPNDAGNSSSTAKIVDDDGTIEARILLALI